MISSFEENATSTVAAGGTTPSPSRRTMRISPQQQNTPGRKKNFAPLLHTSSPHASGNNSNSATLSKPSGRGKVITPRSRATFMRDKIEMASQQDDDGAVERHATVVFQAQPCLLQMINSGEVCLRHINFLLECHKINEYGQLKHCFSNLMFYVNNLVDL